MLSDTSWLSQNFFYARLRSSCPSREVAPMAISDQAPIVGPMTGGNARALRLVMFRRIKASMTTYASKFLRSGVAVLCASVALAPPPANASDPQPRVEEKTPSIDPWSGAKGATIFLTCEPNTTLKFTGVAAENQVLVVFMSLTRGKVYGTINAQAKKTAEWQSQCPPDGVLAVEALWLKPQDVGGVKVQLPIRSPVEPVSGGLTVAGLKLSGGPITSSSPLVPVQKTFEDFAPLCLTKCIEIRGHAALFGRVLYLRGEVVDKAWTDEAVGSVTAEVTFIDGTKGYYTVRTAKAMPSGKVEEGEAHFKLPSDPASVDITNGWNSAWNRGGGSAKGPISDSTAF